MGHSTVGGLALETCVMRRGDRIRGSHHSNCDGGYINGWALMFKKVASRPGVVGVGVVRRVSGHDQHEVDLV